MKVCNTNWIFFPFGFIFSSVYVVKVNVICAAIFSLFLRSEDMDQGGGVLELHTQELKMPHAMIMQDFGRRISKRN